MNILVAHSCLIQAIQFVNCDINIFLVERRQTTNICVVAVKINLWFIVKPRP
jgi:hypothetical protein